MTHLIDAYTTRPADLKSGDIMAVTVTLHIGHLRDADDRPATYRLYLCDWPPTISEDGIPQGERIYEAQVEVAGALFPVVAGLKPG